MGTATELAPPKTKSQALRSFSVADFPALTGREEEWRFTPLKRLRGLDRLTAAEVGDEAAPWPAHEFGSLPQGVSITSIGRDDARLGSVLMPFDRVSALAYSSFDRATLVAFAPQAVLAEAVVIDRTGGPAGVAAFGHMFVEVGQFAEATLVLVQQGSGTLADNVEVEVKDGAKLVFVTVADWDRDAVQAQHVKFKVGRDARVIHVHVSLGGDLVRQYTSVEYTGRGGDVEAWGLYFADGGQHLEHRLLVDHSVPDCRSYVGYRGALQGEGSHTVWVGDVLIRAEATGTDTYEINRNLVLSDGARADSVPNLEIETGEVSGAGHASTTGRFDDEHLFYLMSRGIPEDEARQLVVRGFFAELLGKIPVEPIRERLGKAIEARLSA
jgi:Fe-S cluster assembly protein SufD